MLRESEREQVLPARELLLAELELALLELAREQQLQESAPELELALAALVQRQAQHCQPAHSSSPQQA